MLKSDELKDFLEAKVVQYNTFDFIEPDPISVPHRYSLKQDIEIAGFLAATIAWGNRTMITKNGHRMMDLLGDSPYDFVMNHNEYQLEKLDGFVHRTFNSVDFTHFIKALQYIYSSKNGLEGIFNLHQSEDSLSNGIQELHHAFFEIPHLSRTKKHVANPSQGSVSKRINMFLRWMIRQDNAGVDFGLWKNISPSKLSCPLDVHSGNVARN